MASVFRRSKKKNTPYTIQYTDHDGDPATEEGMSRRPFVLAVLMQLETETPRSFFSMCRLSVDGHVPEQNFSEIEGMKNNIQNDSSSENVETGSHFR